MFFSTGHRAPRGTAQGAVMVALIMAGAAVPAPAQAGFLEQLFGLQPAPAPEAQPVYSQPDVGYAPRHSRPARKKVFVEVIGSGKQTTTDLMHDKTLRRGDAVMMKDGMHVYSGGSRGSHEADDFLPLDQSGLPRKDRVALAAVDATRVPVAERDAGAAGSLASGRSAAVSAPIVEGTVVTDASGRKLRYVGP